MTIYSTFWHTFLYKKKQNKTCNFLLFLHLEIDMIKQPKLFWPEEMNLFNIGFNMAVIST